MNYNFHKHEEPLQRLLNAVEPDSYVRPHRHRESGKTEVFILLNGRGAAFEFDDDGKVTEKYVLEVGGEVRGVIIEPGIWHTLLALEEGTVFFEAKSGPYTPLTDKDFAPWSPSPGDTAGVDSFIQTLRDSLGL
jgi:cupin fold WbuC family metalloprotein